MKKIFILIILLSIGYPQVISACSFVPGYGDAKPYSEFFKATGTKPEIPKIKEIKLTRGFDDGNYASCSDAGILEISLESTTSKKIQSYEITIVKGKFPDKVIPDGFITPIRLDINEYGFMFVWLDSPEEPIDVVLEIRQLSFGNKLSEPKTISVTDKPAANKSLNKGATKVAPIS